jgi:MFS transporter, DHA1 family, inner membrane transport protein
MMVCLIIVLAVGAQTSFGTFNVVWLLDVVNIAPPAIPVLLFLGGVASALGVVLTGVLYNRMPARLFLGSIAALVGLLFALPVIAHSQLAVWVVSTVMALVFAGAPVMLQIRMMLAASVSLSNLAAALQTTAFNVGIGGGAFLGGIAIDHTSLGAVPIWAAIAMCLALAAAAFWELAMNTRDRQER